MASSALVVEWTELHSLKIVKDLSSMVLPKGHHLDRKC